MTFAVPHVQGMLGCGASTQKDGPHVSNQIIGEGKTTQWTLAALDNATTLCVLFEITADGKNSDKMSPGGEAFYLQVHLASRYPDQMYACIPCDTTVYSCIQEGIDNMHACMRQLSMLAFLEDASWGLLKHTGAPRRS